MKVAFEIDVLTSVAILIACLAAFWLFLTKRTGAKAFTVRRLKLNIPFGLGEMDIEPTYEDTRIAYKAWVELVTRKAALPFDPEHDVIVEVYDSWYALFGIMRELAKEIPPEEFTTKKSAQQLIRILVEALNAGLRPHLTKWQARFRHWYLEQLENSGGQNLSPQDIQKKYPMYQELVADLIKVNTELVAYANQIGKIAAVRRLEK